MKITGTTLALALLPGLHSPAAASAAEPINFPVKTVRWVVPFPPGGGIDVVARVIAARLSHAWGVSCSVENRPGAGGRVGVQHVIASPPDGYTQLMTLNTHYTIDRSLFKDLGYDADKSLSPVTIVAATSQLLISNPSFPPKNVKELAALAQARPNAVSHGSSGAGGSLHLAIELFKSITGIRMNHIAYQGGVPAATDLIAGHIQVMFLNTPVGVPYVKSGRVRALGISTAKRSPHLPDVPTLIEAGVQGFDIGVWYGLSVPAGTPAPIITATHQDVTRVLEESDVRRQLIGFGTDLVTVTPDDMARRIRSETASWTKAIQGSSIRFD